MIGLFAVLGVIAVWLVGVNIMASLEIIFCYGGGTNKFAFVVKKGSKPMKPGEVTGGGGFEKIIHEIPGKILTYHSSNDPNNYEFVPGKESRGLLYHLFGIHFMGISRELRVNKVHELTFGKKKTDSAQYDTEPNDYPDKWIQYSREQAINAFGVETAGAYKMDVQGNIKYRISFPYRAIVGLKDPNAYLTGMMVSEINKITGTEQPEYFIQGPASHKRKLEDAMTNIYLEVERQVGFFIDAAVIYSFDVDEEQRKLLELQETTRRNNDKNLLDAENRKQVAEKDKEAKMQKNLGEEDHVKKVLLPLATAPGGPAIRWAEAIENNKSLTTLVLGSDVAQVIGQK